MPESIIHSTEGTGGAGGVGGNVERTPNGAVPMPAARHTLRFSPQRISPVAAAISLSEDDSLQICAQERRGICPSVHHSLQLPIRSAWLVAVAVIHTYLSGAQPRKAGISKKGLMP
jgi:hypothetical protein